ncbi:MAG TPA: AraC family transcriptional regulator [bacterium]|nr:AraC family transcriptional regulator [bacterium]
MSTGLTIAGSITRAVVQVAEEGGVPREELLAAAKLPVEALYNGEPRVPLRSHRAVIREAVRLTGNPALGLEIGRNVRISASSLVGYAAMHARTLRGSIDCFARYFQLMSDGIIVSTREHPGGHLRVCVEAPKAADHPLVSDWEIAAAGLLTILRWISGVDLVPRDACFAYPEPSHVEAYAPIFRCRLRFDAPVTGFLLTRSQLESPTLAPDAQMRATFEAMLEALRGSAPQGPEIVRRLYTQVQAMLGQEAPRLADVARAMHLSVRTLQRELSRAGVTFSSVLDAAVRDSALRQLRDSRLNVEEVAFFHGYAASSAFVRAVRRWTGKTPLAYRRAAG